MKINKEALTFWAGLISALQTPIALAQSLSLLSKSLFVGVGLGGMVLLLLFALRRKGKILLSGDIMRLVAAIDKVKQKITSDDSTGYKWSRKLDDLRFLLSEPLGRWPNRWMFADLRHLVVSAGPWDARGPEVCGIKNALLRAMVLWRTGDFVKYVHGWCLSGMEKSAPARGIDAKVDAEVKGEIARRVAERFARWFGENRKDGELVSVLLVGANDQSLTTQILDAMSETRGCRGLQVFVTGTMGVNELYLHLHYGKDDKHGNRDKIIMQHERDWQPRYDVAIATHYYQHHEVSRCKRMPLNVCSDGLVVWLSAISRSPTIDEFVCEGCTPLRAELFTQKPVSIDAVGKKSPPIEIVPMSSCGSKQWISYAPIPGFEKDVPVLSTGYPKKFVMQRKLLENDPAKVTRQYLEWNQKQRISKILVDSEYHEKEDKDALLYKVNDVQCVLGTRVTKGQNPFWVWIMELRYESDKQHVLYLMVTTGIEVNEWGLDVMGEEDCLVTITPVLPYVAGTAAWEGDYPKRLIVEALRHRFEVDAPGRCAKYEDLLDEGRCRCEFAGVEIYDVRSKIEDVELNHMTMIVASQIVDGHDVVFCAYQPKRRYLTRHDFEIEYGIMEDFKDAVSKMKRDLFLPVMTHSVTWLRGVEGIIKEFRGRGLLVAEEECFFHKALGHVRLGDIDEAKYCQVKLDMNSLGVDDHSLAKDVAFNRLAYNDRLKLLGVANVHDVLIFAVANPNTKCRWHMDGVKRIKHFLSQVVSWFYSIG